MNQILDYNPNKSSGGGSSGSDKIVRVFAVVLIVFALGLLGSGIYNIMKNGKEKNNPVATPTEPKITVEQTEKEILVKVSHDKAINKLTYKWDSGKESTNTGNGESTMEVKIPLLRGEHTLDVKVTDKDGVEASFQDTFISETGEDSTFPEITFEVTPESKLKITAIDETEISFITYRWNDGEEQRIDVSEEDNKQIVEEIEILKGTNDLTVVAVDKSNNTATKMEKYTGVTNPEITITVSEDKKTASVYCFHENGIKEVKLNINDQNFNVEIPKENPEEDPKEVTLNNLELPETKNKISVTAISVDNTEKIAEEEIIREEEMPQENIQINIEQSEDAKDKVNISASAESGIKEMTLNINGQEFMVEMPEEDPKDLRLDPLELVDDVTVIKVKVISVNGVEKVEEKELTK